MVGRHNFPGDEAKQMCVVCMRDTKIIIIHLIPNSHPSFKLKKKNWANLCAKTLPTVVSKQTNRF